MSFDASSMLSFDLETTSVDPREARIVTSALITIDGATTDKVEMLADPGVEIPQSAIDIHGITNEKARADGRSHDDVLDETVRRIKDGWAAGRTLVVYNAAYDLSVLLALTNGSFTVTGPVFDPYVVDNNKDPYRKTKGKGGRTLVAVAEHYGVPFDGAHEATADAMAAARVAWKMANKYYPDIQQLSDDDLMEYQAVAYYDMQMNRRKFFESKGRSSFVNTSWPMYS